MELKVKKLHPDAKLPSYAHASDAGMDLYTVEDFTIEPGSHQLAPTGLAIVIPDGYTALVWDKGGVANKRHIKTVGGVFDTDYRGEYLIGLYNFGAEAQSFKAGDKIAQLIIQRVEHPTLVEVTELDDTPRGEGRFGSTGQ
ncbi:MAG: dUTP diphosphatase [Candidatus Pacebacteria bacterium]|jgi:dUTP pyrophosphatase|nr:dUTP diphosphatase [Candidatus Paceibacterota bacterium]